MERKDCIYRFSDETEDFSWIEQKGEHLHSDEKMKDLEVPLVLVSTDFKYLGKNQSEIPDKFRAAPRAYKIFEKGHEHPAEIDRLFRKILELGP